MNIKNIKLFQKRKKLETIPKKIINWVNDFSENLAWFRTTENGATFYGVINKNYEIIIDPIFKKLKNFSCGLAPYFDGVSWGFIDKKGIVKIQAEYYDIGQGFTENLAPVRKTNKSNYGYVRKNGLYKLPPVYQLAWNFYNGRALVVVNNEFFFINKNGKIISKSLHNYYGV